MRRNIIKRRLSNGETVIGTMVQEVTSPSIAQVFKKVGFDFFMIDMEHGPFGLETVAHILRVGRLLDMDPMVRVPSSEYHLITRPLDHGAMGIMLPRVETRSQVETLVTCMKYPPMGKRGCSSDAPHGEYDFGPLPEFLETNNQDTLVLAQIESKEAMEQVIVAAQRHNLVAGTHMGDVETLLSWREKGMRMIMYSSDLGFLMESSAAGLARLRVADGK